MRLELEGVGRLVERDPGPERPDRHAQRPGRGADVLLDEQEPPRGGLGGQQREVVLAEDPGAHEPEQEAELARRHPPVGQRHGGLGQAATGRDDLVEQVGLELAHERRERTGVGPHPARPIDDAGPFDDARQRAAEGRREGGHDARHRLGVGRFGCLAARPVSGSQVRSAAGRWRSVRPPASRRARAGRPSRHAGRRRSRRRRARIRSGTRPARRGRPATTAGARHARIRRPRRTARRDRSSGRDRQLDAFDVGERRAEQPPCQRVERGRVAGRQLEVPGVRCVGPGRQPRAR